MDTAWPIALALPRDNAKPIWRFSASSKGQDYLVGKGPSIFWGTAGKNPGGFAPGKISKSDLAGKCLAHLGQVLGTFFAWIACLFELQHDVAPIVSLLEELGEPR